MPLLPHWPDSNRRTPEKPAAVTVDTEAVALRRRVIIAAMVFASYMMLLVALESRRLLR
jgi:hypothetical protein